MRGGGEKEDEVEEVLSPRSGVYHNGQPSILTKEIM